MPKKNITEDFNSLLALSEQFKDEQDCRIYLEKMRWGSEPVCPHCQYTKVYRYKDGKLFKCAKCRRQFTVKVGTIFEDSQIPLRKWFLAIYLVTAHKKGISSLQLSRDIAVTQKSAWFMLHRIRYSMRTKSFNKPLENIVEVDETYIGGKKRNRGFGRGTYNKIPVFGLVERQGNVITMPVTKADGKTLIPIIIENVNKTATIMTDDFGGYYYLKQYFKHGIINHSSKIYVKGDIHTNTIEGFWSLLKRGIYGIYHRVSPKHLHRYCTEFEYRYNHRKVKDPHRFTNTLAKCEGRLLYKDLIGRIGT